MRRETATRTEKDLRKIKENYIFNGIVSDGGTGIVSAINEVSSQSPSSLSFPYA